MPEVRNYQGDMIVVPEAPLPHQMVGSCNMLRGGCRADPTGDKDKPYRWTIDPDCPYHQAAASQPWNHTIPWNCPTYWDGCNCDGGPYFP